jgi:hypothetical protein
MKFSQLSFEFGFLQVGLGRLWFLQVKETKGRAKITQMGEEIDTFPQWSRQSVAPLLSPK